VVNAFDMRGGRMNELESKLAVVQSHLTHLQQTSTKKEEELQLLIRKLKLDIKKLESEVEQRGLTITELKSSAVVYDNELQLVKDQLLKTRSCSIKELEECQKSLRESLEQNQVSSSSA
jgi:uncharacterized coiled-coil protein SlyX